jgi:hypothetical protein
MNLKLRDDVTATSTEYGLVLLDETGGEYWNLNPTGTLVVRTIIEGGTPQQAARMLADEYRVEDATAAADVDELLSQLRSSGLVEVEGGESR